jgi:hypothetical protein
MEDIVGVSFFALLLPAIVVTISASRNTLAPRQQQQWRGWGLCLVSIAFLAFGLINFQLIHSSPRPVVEGNIWDIHELTTTKAHSSRFMITDAAGKAVQIRCSYRGPGLQEGERPRVRYVAYDSKLLELDMLTGPYQLWHLHESSGEQGCWGWLAIGLVCGFFAYRQLAKVKHEQPVGSN